MALQPTAGAIWSATSWTTSCTPTVSVSAVARFSRCEIVTRRAVPRAGMPAVRPVPASGRARAIRTLSPSLPGYRRKESQSPGGRSATNEVTCPLISAAR
ncbi:hypothetical protein MBT84_04715 [Streptomyces sp. MBT84]|nr:hypothetical protein [Streptomyces sp. MBT84]